MADKLINYHPRWVAERDRYRMIPIAKWDKDVLKAMDVLHAAAYEAEVMAESFLQLKDVPDEKKWDAAVDKARKAVVAFNAKELALFRKMDAWAQKVKLGKEPTPKGYTPQCMEVVLGLQKIALNCREWERYFTRRFGPGMKSVFASLEAAVPQFNALAAAARSASAESQKVFSVVRDLVKKAEPLIAASKRQNTVAPKEAAEALELEKQLKAARLRGVKGEVEQTLSRIQHALEQLGEKMCKAAVLKPSMNSLSTLQKALNDILADVKVLEPSCDAIRKSLLQISKSK